MVHYTRVQGLTDYVRRRKRSQGRARCRRAGGLRGGVARPQSAGLWPVRADPRGVAAAAADEIRKRFLRAPLPVAEQIALVEAVAAATDAPDFNVQYGPAAVQWCSDALLRAVAEASAATARRIHMHCLETRYQRDWADANFANGMIRYLDEIGLL